MTITVEAPIRGQNETQIASTTSDHGTMLERQQNSSETLGSMTHDRSMGQVQTQLPQKRGCVLHPIHI